MSSFSYYRSVLNGVALAMLALFKPANADDEFNLRILELDTPLENTSTLKNFIGNNSLLAGSYPVTIKWGRDIIDKRTVTFVLSKDKQRLLPEFTKADLRDFGLKVDTLPGMQELDDSARVEDISHFIEGAQYDFNQDDQTLSLVIPQIYRDQTAAGTINPKYWDDGASAAWASYQVSGSQQETDSGKNRSTWLGLDSGINLGAWRLRNNSTWSDTSGWDAISTSLQRDIKALRSQLEIGQTATNGELFDSVQMTGIKLETDTSMLPTSQQGFAPVVRGIANSDAKVTIKQNGYTVYQTNVAPGPFEIRDLSQVTSGTDLEVTVEEADGSEHSFIQASASVPILQREGAFKYSLAAGTFRGNEGEEEPAFVQGTAIYGLPYGVTVYTGALGASLYNAFLAGVGADLGRYGSASVDVTAAHTVFDDGRDPASGLSWRAQYSKDIPDTDTTVTLASYRYSTSGFYTFQEAIDQRDSHIDDGIYTYRRINNRRSRVQVNLSQRVGDWGSTYINAYQQHYWDMSGSERSVSAGFSSSWRDITWSVSYNLTRTPDADNDRQMALMVNIPFSHWLPNAWASYSLNTASGGDTSHQAGIGGTALEDNNLSYNLQQSYTSNNVGYGASLSGRYRGSAGEVGLGYSYGGSNRQWNYSAKGSVVAHEHGVTLGQSVRDAFAIVHIKGGNNVKVQNGRGIYTDYFGNAIVPTLTAYRHNGITVNTQDRDDLDIEMATQDVVPTKGAAMMANFDARSGQRALITLLYRGKPVPFGALVTFENNTVIVGDDGEAWFTGLRDVVPFTVQWGEEQDQHCSGAVQVPSSGVSGILKTTISCQ
ncbi:fimbria/pilus outer membrane usher protein [Enterobacter hormaechei]|uniref:fimbria/pilus outer membrane usher protein n=1 Tax=Enterobacter hormaechei TaxID=158836 RepID=UPI00298B27EE|nr:fimbrial biogenesis outer membrane usher protein [Enterobacter hormaechei]HBL5177336.1 fimbrial biogenesis outer membrane usher protein [Enterobacter hormaechei]HBL6016451.1 fimbrial biogenesis outer membrane usher protein [Enterobacter hormaechei]HBL6130913.1 fimbrial biogenesis outer membrane usher protein [Enterobacter hormaechei]HBL8997776.1 fimbrial biogenesis outer membrane usher protein [Enterobacter hormaechei]